MSLRIIRNAKDIPIWFDISRYQKANKLDINGWFANIAIRTEWLNNETPGNKAEFHEQMFADPIVTSIETIDPAYCWTCSPVNNLSVYSLTKLHQIVLGYQQTINEDDPFCYHDPELGPSCILHQSVADILRHVNFITDGIAQIEVNLNAPDELILHSFKEWLAIQRSEEADPLTKRLNKTIDESDFADWTEKQLLAFVDIEIWSKFEDTRITDNAIGAAIFPNEYDISLSERIRKVIRPLSRNVFNWAFLAALETQLNNYIPRD